VLLLIIILVLAFGLAGGYYGYGRWGTGGGAGIGIGTILVILLVCYFLGFSASPLAAREAITPRSSQLTSALTIFSNSEQKGTDYRFP
jgi:hypothetical protein